MSRLLCQFSCGAASAVATKLVIAQNAGAVPLLVLNAYLENEAAIRRIKEPSQ